MDEHRVLLSLGAYALDLAATKTATRSKLLQLLNWAFLFALALLARFLSANRYCSLRACLVSPCCRSPLLPLYFLLTLQPPVLRGYISRVPLLSSRSMRAESIETRPLTRSRTNCAIRSPSLTTRCRLSAYYTTLTANICHAGPHLRNRCLSD